METGIIQHITLIVRDQFETAADKFGIWRNYPRRPTREPDASLSLDNLAANPMQTDPPSRSVIIPEPPDSANHPYWPFANVTIHRMMQWLNNGSTTKSEAQINELVNNVILTPEFSQDHLTGFDAHKENIRLDNALAKSSLHQQFTESVVDILVPSESGWRASSDLFLFPDFYTAN